MSQRRSRLAPSPTGALHLGNARTFLINWALARQHDWSLILRIEDLDHPRVKPETIDQARRDLSWLGIDWDEEVPVQTTDLDPCRQALVTLGKAGKIFACNKTRREIECSAPQEGDASVVYPAAMRPADAGKIVANPDPSCSWRLLVEDGDEVVNDVIAGTHTFNLSRSPGDFPVWTAPRRTGGTGGPTYQMAVVVDDARQGVTDVLRGNDLLDSAARQQVLYRTLGLSAPTWWHVPLVRGPDGRRLAKRHGDTRVEMYRQRGCAPHQIIGLMAYWCGLTSTRQTLSADEFCDAMDLSCLPREDVTLTDEDVRWLD